MKEMIKLVPLELNVAELVVLIFFTVVCLLVVGLLVYLFVLEIIDRIKFHRKYSDKSHRHFPSDAIIRDRTPQYKTLTKVRKNTLTYNKSTH